MVVLKREDWQTGCALTVEMQEIEGVVNQPNAALAMARGLSLGETWQAIVANAATQRRDRPLSPGPSPTLQPRSDICRTNRAPSA
jgi:hypothetical protein